MTKARDLSNLISSGTISNSYITLDANEIPSLDTSKITTGTFADARISSSSVTQHSTPFDDDKIVNDISTLALRQASDANKSAYNTNSQFVDVFQDDTGIDTHTNTSRDASEYVSSVYGTAVPTGSVFLLKGDQANGSTTFTDSTGTISSLSGVNSIAHSSTQGKIGSTSIYFGTTQYITGTNQTYFDFGTGEFRIECWFLKPSSSSNYFTIFSQGGWGTNADYAGTMVVIGNDNKMRIYSSVNQTGSHGGWSVETISSALNWSANTWYHLCWSRGSDGVIRIFRDGTEVSTYDSTTGKTGSTNMAEGDRNYVIGMTSDLNFGASAPMYIDNLVIAKGSGSGITSNFTPITQHYGITASATGNFTGTTITAPSSVSSMGAIITYQDNAGTNALNTDLVLQLSADNGSNWSTATLSALPNFATGIKMAKVNDLAVTAGTQLKYKLSFANQSSGSKEARIRGVALQY